MRPSPRGGSLGARVVLVEGSGAPSFARAFVAAWEEAGREALARVEVARAPSGLPGATWVAPGEGLRERLAEALAAQGRTLVVATEPTGLAAGLHVAVGEELFASRGGRHLALRRARSGVARALARTWGA
ncbi:MAG: hypothetical protein AAGH15_27540 [Myxococcota bacterium]